MSSCMIAIAVIHPFLKVFYVDMEQLSLFKNHILYLNLNIFLSIYFGIYVMSQNIGHFLSFCI